MKMRTAVEADLEPRRPELALATLRHFSFLPAEGIRLLLFATLGRLFQKPERPNPCGAPSEGVMKAVHPQVVGQKPPGEGPGPTKPDGSGL